MKESYIVIVVCVCVVLSRHDNNSYLYDVGKLLFLSKYRHILVPELYMAGMADAFPCTAHEVPVKAWRSWHTIVS